MNRNKGQKQDEIEKAHPRSDSEMMKRLKLYKLLHNGGVFGKHIPKRKSIGVYDI